MIPALFFDLDGTLVDSEPLHWLAWRTALRQIKIELSWQRYLDEAVGHPDPEILRLLATHQPGQAAPDPASILRSKKRHFIELVEKRTPLSHATVMLIRQLPRLPKALVTSSPRAEAEAILRGGGIAAYFNTMVCLEDVHSAKPDPEPYLIAMKRLDVSQGIAFEDSRSGQASAMTAGLEVVDVSSPSELPNLVRTRLSLSAWHSQENLDLAVSQLCLNRVATPASN